MNFMSHNRPYTPAVSVCMVCYNHAAFVGEAVSSVLRQTFVDFEFLILDNGSVDDSVAVIKTFDDPRISVRVLAENVHSTCAANMLLEKATGRYVALICSDDAWMSDKLARQVAFLEDHPDCAVVFSRVEVMDEHGKPCRLPTAYDCWFNTQPNRDRDAWLRFLYAFNNPFCCSSAVLRLSAFRQCGPYDERSRSVQDLILWMRILFHHGVHILESKLVRMRYYSRASNISGVNAANMVLTANEAQLFYGTFFTHVSSGELFSHIFPDAEAQHHSMAVHDPQLALALHTLASPPTVMAGAWALHCLYGLTATAQQRQKYQERYGFGILDLYAQAQAVDVYGQRRSCLREFCYGFAKLLLGRLRLLMPLKYYLMRRALQ